MFIRASIADVPYVPNTKYLAHLAHQTPFDPIYQMCRISYFLQHVTVKSQICHGTDECRIWIYYFIIPLSLSSLRHYSQPRLLPTFTPILSSQTPILTALPHRCRGWRLSLGSNLTTSWMLKTCSSAKSSPQTKWVFHHQAHSMKDLKTRGMHLV